VFISVRLKKQVSGVVRAAFAGVTSSHL